MERQSFWWRTRAAELLSDLAASSFLGLRGFAMAISECSACACGERVVFIKEMKRHSRALLGF